MRGMERLVGFALANRRMAAAVLLSLGLHFAGLYELRLPLPGRAGPARPLTVTLEGVEALLPPPEEGVVEQPPAPSGGEEAATGGEGFAPLEPSLPPVTTLPPPSPEEFDFPLPPPPPPAGEGSGVAPGGAEEGALGPPPPPEGTEEAAPLEAPVCEFEATITPAGMEPLKPVEGGASPPPGVRPPQPLLALMPPYPDEAVRKGLEGEVSLDILVGKDGRPLRARATGEKGLEPLAKPVLEAVRSWRFKPALRDGKPVEAVVRVRFKFSLGGAPKGAPLPSVVAVAPPKGGERPKVEGREIEVAVEYLGVITPALIRPLVKAKPQAPSEGGAREEALLPPRPLFPLMPPYPKDALEAGEEGEVVVYALVGEDGSLKKAAVEASGAPVSLVRAALEALSTWRFEPAKRGGKPVEAWVRIRFRFAKEVKKSGEGQGGAVSAEAEAPKGPEGAPQEGGEAPRPSGAVSRPGGEAGAQGEGGPRG